MDLPHDYFMQQAINEAQKAYEKDEVPVGAVVAYKNKIIARSHNLSQTLGDATAHAEMQTLTAAADHVGSKYLNQCRLYVTLEPCIMCAGAGFWTQIGAIIYGASDEKRGFTTCSSAILHPKTQVIAGIMAEQCSKLLKDFFEHKRP